MEIESTGRQLTRVMTNGNINAVTSLPVVSVAGNVGRFIVALV